MPQPIRGSEVFIAEDVLRFMRTIAATHEATRRVSGSGGGDYGKGYSDGLIDGLRALAESMGIQFAPGRNNSSLGIRWDG